jgi:hypothetical protein
MSTYRLFPATDGPASAVTYTGDLVSGIGFCVSGGGCWFEGYWWWVCPTGGLTAPQKFALWQLYASDAGSLIDGSVITSGELSPGWNYISLPAPLNLSPGVSGLWEGSSGWDGSGMYIACTGVNGNFPDTQNYFGAGDAAGNGIVKGPLTAFSDVTIRGGTLPAPYGTAQGVYTLSGTDPSTSLPLEGTPTSDNLWMDIQISDTAPAGYSGSYRGWPNYPIMTTSLNNDTEQETSANELWLSLPCRLDNIWFFSPPGASLLPMRCGIWNIATQAEVPGTDVINPVWSGAPGSGWVACAYSGVFLPAGKYRVSTWWDGTDSRYYNDLEGYFGANPTTGVLGPGGVDNVNGPLTIPCRANASDANWDDGSGSKPGQGTNQAGPWAFPRTYECKSGWPDGTVELRAIDVEVSPGSAPADSTAFLAFFP